MPKEYTECRDSYVRRGVPLKDAKARCAGAYVKRHGITVQEAKKRGYATDMTDEEWSMAESIVTAAAGKTPSIKVEAAYGTAVSERVSLGATDRPDFGEDGLITVIAARVGSPAVMRDPTGIARRVKWSEAALNKMAPTWVGGSVNPNHTPTDEGRIVTSRMEGPDLVQTFAPSKGLLEAIAHSWPHVGVSTEAAVSKLSEDGSEVLDGHGIGLAVVFYPMSPLCPPEKGCRILAGEQEIATAAELWDVDDPEYWDMSLRSELAEAAKLTTKQRNELPGTSFCGPERSFPAHDAAHVRNGLARLNQSRFGPSTRAHIRACLVRRAKEFRIEVSKGADMTEENHDKDCDCAAKAAAAEVALQSAEQAKAELATTQGQLAKATSELNSLRDFRNTIEGQRRKDLLGKAEKLGANDQLQVLAALPLDALLAVVDGMESVAARHEKISGSGADPNLKGLTDKEKLDAEMESLRKAEAAMLGRDPETYRVRKVK